MPARWSGNVRGPTAAFSHKKKSARSSIAKARSEGDPLLFEDTFRTGIQQHTCLEPHVAVARFDGPELTVHVSTQIVAELKTKIAKHFKLDPGKVRVVSEHIGGGFGSKTSLGAETIVAIKLAEAAKAPVRVAFSRHEELSVAGYRPGTEIKIAILPGRDGALKALSLTAYSDAGVAVNSTAAGLARLIYPAEAKELVDYDVVSNLPPGSPFRGPGGPPMAFALEQAIDEAALRLKTDPIQLRKRWDPNPNRQRLYDWAAGLETWRRYAGAPASGGRYRRGVGVAAGYWFYLWQLGSTVELSIEGGRLAAGVATQDIGTGTRSVIADTVARELGLEPHEVEVRIGNSALPAGTWIRRKPRHRVDCPAAPARDRQAQGRRRPKDRPKTGAGIERAVARTHCGRARSQSRGHAPRGQWPDHLWQQLAHEGRRDDRHDLRLHDAALAPRGDRGRGAELGPGRRGGSRYVARPCARAQNAHRRRCRQARSAGAGAQPGRGRDRPGIGLRSLRGTRSRSPDRRSFDDQPRRLSYARHRRRSADRCRTSTRAGSTMSSEAASASARWRPCRRRPRSPTPFATRSACGPPKSRSGPTGSWTSSARGARHDGADANNAERGWRRIPRRRHRSLRAPPQRRLTRAACRYRSDRRDDRDRLRPDRGAPDRRLDDDRRDRGERAHR